MPFGSAFEAAALKAGREGSCPVWMLEDFYTNHWDFETLCSSFNCGECVAAPEDMGPTEPWAPGTGPSSDEIPF